MRLPVPRAPGWYPDRQDATLVRYWDGREWTSRLRPMPVWLPDPTDLVDPAPLHWPQPRGGSPRPRRRKGLREALGAGVVLALVGVLTVGTVLTGRGRELVGAARAKATPAITDPLYVRQADAACASAAAARPAVTSAQAAQPAVTSARGQDAAAIRALAARAAAIRGGLDALPTPPGDDGVSTWLESWGALVRASRRYASALDHAGAPTAGPAGAYRQARGQVDAFARVNGMQDCQI